MKKLVIYIHGQGGNRTEAHHYKALFPQYDVTGIDYKSEYPWQAEKEFSQLFDEKIQGYDGVILIANSLGAYFSLVSLGAKNIEKAFFISPVVDMEKLICNMMSWRNVSEKELSEKGEINTDFGQTLSWEYLCYTRKTEAEWNIPTHILYGEKDNLTDIATIQTFADKINATLTVMPNGEHWFHTDSQMEFLDSWVKDHA